MGEGERRRRATYAHGQEVLFLGQRHWDPGNSCIHWLVLKVGDILGVLAAV